MQGARWTGRRDGTARLPRSTIFNGLVLVSFFLFSVKITQKNLDFFDDNRKFFPCLNLITRPCRFEDPQIDEYLWLSIYLMTDRNSLKCFVPFFKSLLASRYYGLSSFMKISKTKRKIYIGMIDDTKY